VLSFAHNLIRESKHVGRGVKNLRHLSLSTLRKVFSLMGKWERIALVMFLGIAAASSSVMLNYWYVNSTSAQPTSGGIYSEGMLGQPRLINPILASTPPDTALVNLIFSGLYKYDGSGKLVPDLAESMPQIDETQKQYTVKLRPGLRWHNERPFSADDVLFTIKTLQDPRFNSPLRSEWLNTSVEKIDDQTLVFKVKDISGPFIHNLTLPIINKSIWERIGADNFLLSNNNLEAIGTGPYLIKEIKKLPQGTIQSIKLEAFPNYYAGRPHLDTIRVVFYENHEDVLQGLHGDQITGFGFVPFDKNIYLDRDNKSLRIIELPLPQYQATFYNLSHRAFSDKNVRKALDIATDKEQIIRDVFNGSSRLINGPILPEQVEDIPMAAHTYNLSQAQTILDAAGWTINPQTNVRTKGNAALEFTLATNDFPLNVKTAEMLVSQWSKLNILVKLNILPTKELTDNVIRTRKFDALLYSHRTGADPDPFIFWHSSQSKNPGLNLTGFSNTAADKLISEARTTTKKEVRDDKYRQFQALIAEESPALFLNQTVYIYALDRSLKGISLENLNDASQRFYNVTNWYMDERRVWKN
jgi:peptide/nickel transport system substrate-binding protein